MLRTFIAQLTPPCKDVTRLASQAMDRPLPWATRLNLQLHFWICEACARYRDQLNIVRQTLRRSAVQGQTPESSAPSPDTKARLTEAFRAKRD